MPSMKLRDHPQGRALLTEVEAAIPLSAAALCKSPKALAIWAQAAIKIECDALGMAEPARPTTQPANLTAMAASTPRSGT